MFRFICHRIPERCKIGNLKLPICTRCFGLYSSLILFSLLFIILKFDLDKPLLLILAIGFILPLAIDGTTQYIGLRISNNRLRLLTGILAGIGCALLLAHLVL